MFEGELDGSFTISQLPVWNGVTSEKSELPTEPFSIYYDFTSGLIRQKASPELLKRLTDHYSSDKYSFGTPPPGSSDWANRCNEDFVQMLFEKKTLKGLNILEVGAGSDYLGKIIVGKGASHYTIVDPTLSYRTGTGQITVIPEFFGDNTVSSGKFDLAISLNTIEHVADPVAFLNNLHLSLNENGELYLVFPGVREQFEKGDVNVLLHEHLQYFTRESAEALLISGGFKVIQSEFRKDCLYFYCHKAKLNPHAIVHSDEGLLLKSISKFNSRFNENVQKIKSVGQNGKKIAFHGATNGLNNLIFLSGVNTDHFFIFDGDRTKTGKWLPAARNPVLWSKDPVYREMDYVFISGMTFFDEIKKEILTGHGIPEDRIFSL